MIKASIIGCRGIGMAHAIDLDKNGVDIVAVFDIDENLRKNIISDEWCNKWGYIVEKHQPLSKPLFTTDFSEFCSITSDVVIICTPTQYHIEYIEKCIDIFPYVLCEKPVCYHEKDLKVSWKNVFSSHEWIFNSNINNDPIQYIAMGHNFPPEEQHKKDCGIIWDLGIHLAAMLFAKQDIIIKTIEKTISPSYFRININGSVIIEASYDWKDDKDGLWINDKRCTWEDGMFYKQINAIVNGKNPCNIDVIHKSVEFIRNII